MTVYAGQYGPDNFIDPYGNPVRNTPFEVRQDGLLVDLYEDRERAVAMSNPGESDVLGNIKFFTEPGFYQLTVGDTTLDVVVHPDPADAVLDEDGPVSSVNGETGAVVLDAADVGAATAAQGGLADTAVQPGDLGGAASLSVGTTAGTVAAGDDARFTDARTPTAHKTSHSTGGTDALSPADIGAATSSQGSLADSAVQPGDLGGAASLNVGTTAGTVAAGDDARFTDARTPTSHASSHGSLGSDPISIAHTQVSGLGTAATLNAGSASGVAELDSGGKVPSAQLPSYVDDVVEAANFAALPGTGETGKIYITLDDGLTFRWSGSAYVEISASLALGETSATAYRGDRGKTAYDHSQLITGNPHGTTAADVGADPAGTAAGLVDDLSGVSNQATARSNLGLGSAATSNTGDFEAAGAVSAHAGASDPHGDRAYAYSSDVDFVTAGVRYSSGIAATAFGTVPQASHITVGTRSVVVTEAARSAASLGSWPDGSMGFASIGGTIYGFASNGENNSRWTATAGTLLGTVHQSSQVLTTSQAADYASGGPIYHDTGTGRLLKIWHGERYDSDPAAAGSFVSFLGLATATDGAPDTWTDLGRIITPQAGVSGEIWADMGGGTMVTYGGYMYVYFTDTRGTPTLKAERTNISVARASVADLVTWAGGGASTTFTKWNTAGWTGAGIDGHSDPVITSAPYPAWMSAIRLSSHGDRIMLVWSCKVNHSDDHSPWAIYTAISEPGDPTTFGKPELLLGPSYQGYLYPTLVSPTLTENGVVSGDTIRMYVTESVGFVEGSDRWADAEVALYELTYNPGDLRVVGGLATLYNDQDDTNPVGAIGSVFGMGAFAFGPSTGAYDILLNRNGTGTMKMSLGSSLELPKLRLTNLGSIPAQDNVIGDTVIISGEMWVCTVAGNPGTWVQIASVSDLAALTAGDVGADPSGTASSAITTHEGDTTAHPASSITWDDTLLGLGETEVQAAIEAFGVQMGTVVTNQIADRRTATAPNTSYVTVNGAAANSAVTGGGGTTIQASTINGGGTATYPNQITNGGTANTIGGGYDNLITATGVGANSIAGGGHHAISGDSTHGTISGGSYHDITDGDYNTIGGGTANAVSSTAAGTIAGGQENTATAQHASVGGGYRNDATGNYSTVSGGNDSTASGSVSTVGGGQTNTATQTGATVAGGQNNDATGTYAGVLGGLDNDASGSYSACVGGTDNDATGSYSTTLGRAAKSYTEGSVAHASGKFSVVGDAQYQRVTLRRQTTDGTANVVLGPNGAATPITLQTASTVQFRIMVVARQASTGDSAAWTFQGLCTNDTAASVTFIGGTPTAVTVAADAGAAAWTVDLLGGTDSFNVRVTGEAAKTINWMALVEMLELVA